MKHVRYILMLFGVSIMSICGVNAMSCRTHIINSPVDLRGETIEIPVGHKLVFKGEGCLMNGIIVGNQTSVTAGKRHIFVNVELQGAYTARRAYSDWFDIIDDCMLDNEGKFVSGTDNSQGFNNLFRFDNVCIAPGCYMISQCLSCVASQTIEGNGATIKFRGKGVCLSFSNVEEGPLSNVSMRNMNIIGSKLEYDDKTEYWHGISIGYAQYVNIENVSVSLCRGDGIYIGGLQKTADTREPSNITLKLVRCLKNHRQGMSITRGSDILVMDSEFAGTSGTLPSCGVDIEPNIDKEKRLFNECKDIRFINCKFEDNDNPGLMISARSYDSESLDNMIKGVIVDGCSFNNNGICVYGVNGLSVTNSNIQNGGISMTAYGRIQNVNIKNVSVSFDKENTASGFQLSLIKQPCKNISISDFYALRCGIFGVYVTRGTMKDENGGPAHQLDGLVLKNIKVAHCTNSVFVSEYVGNVTYDGVYIKDNGVDSKGRKMKSKYGRNIEFMKLDDLKTRVERQ